ncbi:hypothetical protein NAI43_09340 [Francisella tularensis subsp. holarctica]|nr:hypothetical protein [Francisella tularensis]MDE4976056.1 hypothetical protein [Francisella tularensis subsp. holarctica]
MCKRFYWIKIKDYNRPQIDLLQDCSPFKFKELTNLLFPSLKIKDTDDNYYAQFSRDAR